MSSAPDVWPDRNRESGIERAAYVGHGHGLRASTMYCAPSGIETRCRSSGRSYRNIRGKKKRWSVRMISKPVARSRRACFRRRDRDRIAIEWNPAHDEPGARIPRIVFAERKESRPAAATSDVVQRVGPVDRPDMVEDAVAEAEVDVPVGAVIAPQEVSRPAATRGRAWPVRAGPGETSMPVTSTFRNDRKCGVLAPVPHPKSTSDAGTNCNSLSRCASHCTRPIAK